MKSKKEKQQDAEQLHKLLGGVQNVIVTGFEHITVEQDLRLRRAVREAGGGYRVIKNTLAATAAKGTVSEQLLGGLTGMTSLAYTENDPVALAKALSTYAKENPTFTFKAGVVEGRVVDASGIKQLSELPSRDELFSKLLYIINAPATGLARAIGGVGRNLAVVVDQGCKEGKFSS